MRLGPFNDGSSSMEPQTEQPEKVAAPETQHSQLPVSPPKPKRVKPKSRPERWAEAAANATAALSDLSEIQSEYQDWYDNMNENLQQSTTGDMLQTICDLDISGALDTANEAENIDLPRGFGRD